MERPYRKLTNIDTVQFFWSKVDIKGRDDCWEWMGDKTDSGYGRFNVDKKTKRAHRVALQLHLGRELKPRALACHQCDNPGCCNPNHLYEGTQKSNVHDAIDRRRFVSGDSHPCARLTRNQVLEIRGSTKPKSEIARQFAVTRRTIFKIQKCISWKHI